MDRSGEERSNRAQPNPGESGWISIQLCEVYTIQILRAETQEIIRGNYHVTFKNHAIHRDDKLDDRPCLRSNDDSRPYFAKSAGNLSFNRKIPSNDAIGNLECKRNGSDRVRRMGLAPLRKRRAKSYGSCTQN